jgi:hypothetical protein
MKLKSLLKESQHLDYKRMNVGEEEEKGMTNEEKRAFLEAVSQYKRFGESIYRTGNLAEVYESIKGIVETAQKVTLEETGDWFDKVTVNRHMKSMNESFKVFSNTIKEVNVLQQRLESCYDEMGEVLGKYYEIKEAEEKEADMEEGNEFGAARAKAIAAGDSEFEVDGKKYKVTSVDDEDKENAKDFTEESINESKYTVVNPKNGNVMGQGMKDQAAKLAKKMGGEKMGYFVIPVKNALKARRALEKFNFDVKNPKLKDIMSDLYFEEVEGNKSMKLTSIMEGYSTEEKRIVLMAVKKIMKYMNVDIKTAMMYVLGAGQELERDIEKGKVK